LGYLGKYVGWGFGVGPARVDVGVELRCPPPSLVGRPSSTARKAGSYRTKIRQRRRQPALAGVVVDGGSERRSPVRRTRGWAAVPIPCEDSSFSAAAADG
jgi:hypothetical protein